MLAGCWHKHWPNFQGILIVVDIGIDVSVDIGIEVPIDIEKN